MRGGSAFSHVLVHHDNGSAEIEIKNAKKATNRFLWTWRDKVGRIMQRLSINLDTHCAYGYELKTFADFKYQSYIGEYSVPEDFDIIKNPFCTGLTQHGQGTIRHWVNEDANGELCDDRGMVVNCKKRRRGVQARRVCYTFTGTVRHDEAVGNYQRKESKKTSG